MLEHNRGEVLHEEGFLVAVEVQKGVDPGYLKHMLADALTWIEGVGKTDIHYMGKVEQAHDPHEQDNNEGRSMNDK